MNDKVVDELEGIERALSRIGDILEEIRNKMK